jgi:hypothetical protein
MERLKNVQRAKEGTLRNREPTRRKKATPDARYLTAILINECAIKKRAEKPGRESKGNSISIPRPARLAPAIPLAILLGVHLIDSGLRVGVQEREVLPDEGFVGNR